MKKDNKVKIIYFGVFVLSAMFYLTWYLVDGIILTPDAETYISMSSIREPGYSTFLWLFRSIFGEEKYLDAAVVIQCMIAAIAATMLTHSLQKRFHLNWFMSGMILLIQYGITLLNRFVAQRRYSYYNSIETEGIAYSLWIFFVLCIIAILYDRSKSAVVGAFLLSVTLMSIRKQMVITFGILFLAIIVAWWKGNKKYIIILLSTAIMISGMLFVNLLDCTYNYAMRGVFAPHTGDSSFLFGTEVYVADEDMAERISTEENRGLFLEMLKRADEKQFRLRYAGNGWQAVESHYSDSYDRIKFDIVEVVIREHQIEKGLPEELRSEESNRIINEIAADIMSPCIPDILKIIGCNILHGLVTTVLKTHRILNWAALFLYLAYIVLCLWLFYKKSYCSNKPSVLVFAGFTLFLILVNDVFTSLVIYPQMRYMLYNTGLFYQAGILLLYELYQLRKREG